MGTPRQRNLQGRHAARTLDRPAVHRWQSPAHGALSELRSGQNHLGLSGICRGRFFQGTRRALGGSRRRLHPCHARRTAGAAIITASPARIPTARWPTKAAGRTTARWACTRTSAWWRTSSRNSMLPASGFTTRRPTRSISCPSRAPISPRPRSKSCDSAISSSSRASPKAPVRHITLKGFTFRHAARTFMDTKEPLLRSDWTIYRGGAVLLTGTENIAHPRLRVRPGRRQCRLRQQLQPPGLDQGLPHP